MPEITISPETQHEIEEALKQGVQPEEKTEPEEPDRLCHVRQVNGTRRCGRLWTERIYAVCIETACHKRGYLRLCSLHAASLKVTGINHNPGCEGGKGLWVPYPDPNPPEKKRRWWWKH